MTKSIEVNSIKQTNKASKTLTLMKTIILGGLLALCFTINADARPFPGPWVIPLPVSALLLPRVVPPPIPAPAPVVYYGAYGPGPHPYGPGPHAYGPGPHSHQGPLVPTPPRP